MYGTPEQLKIKVKCKLYVERNMRLLLRKTVGIYGSRAQRAHISHTLELEGQAYHFSWSK